MKTMGKIVLMLLVVVSFSCRSTKTVEKAEVKTNAVEQKEIATTNNKTLQATSQQQTADKTTAVDSTSETKTEVELSKPDSVGKQYPTKIIITDRSGKRTVKNDVAMVNVETLQATAQQQTVDKSKTKANSDVKTETTAKKSSPLWIDILAIVAMIAICVALYLWLR